MRDPRRAPNHAVQDVAAIRHKQISCPRRLNSAALHRFHLGHHLQELNSPPKFWLDVPLAALQCHSEW